MPLTDKVRTARGSVRAASSGALFPSFDTAVEKQPAGTFWQKLAWAWMKRGLIKVD
jgi:hypothetical protein